MFFELFHVMKFLAKIDKRGNKEESGSNNRASARVPVVGFVI
jgi:hypothetical protein